MTENALGKDSFKPDAGHYPIVVVIRQKQNQHAVVLGLAADAPSVEELRCIFLDILPVRAVRHNNTNLRTFAVGNKVQIAVNDVSFCFCRKHVFVIQNIEVAVRLNNGAGRSGKHKQAQHNGKDYRCQFKL